MHPVDQFRDQGLESRHRAEHSGLDVVVNPVHRGKKRSDRHGVEVVVRAGLFGGRKVGFHRSSKGTSLAGRSHPSFLPNLPCLFCLQTEHVRAIQRGSTLGLGQPKQQRFGGVVNEVHDEVIWGQQIHGNRSFRQCLGPCLRGAMHHEQMVAQQVGTQLMIPNGGSSKGSVSLALSPLRDTESVSMPSVRKT